MNDFPFPATITSFTLQIYRNNELVFNTTNIGAYYTAEAWEAISRMKAGDRLQIEDVKVRGPNNYRPNLQGRSFYKP